MNCARLETLLNGYLEAELAPPVREAVELHLQDCARCRELLAEVRTLREQLRSFPSVPVREELVGAILDATTGRPVRTPFWQEILGPWIAALRSPRYAFATLVMFAFLSLMVNVLGPSFSASSASWFSPAHLADRAEQLSGEAYRKWREFVEFRRRVIEELKLMREDLWGRLDYHLIRIMFRSYQESLEKEKATPGETRDAESQPAGEKHDENQ
ncbi:MAG: hypothetical protein Kow00109_16340 [Acidobacteriota bacterium]